MLEVKMHLCSKIEKDRHYIQLGGRGRSRGAEGQGGGGGGGGGADLPTFTHSRQKQC